MAKLGTGSRLGTGLDALLGGGNTNIGIVTEKYDREQNSAGVQKLDINKVEPDKGQPRKQFDEDGLIELSESIKQHGVIQPILVRKEEDYYRIVAGERRWRAAKYAKLTEIPTIIIDKDISDQEARIMSLIENIQREDLNPIDEAKAYKELMDDYDLKQEDVAKKVNKSRTAIANLVRLLNLDERVQQLLMEENDFKMGHARALLAIEDNDKQYEFALKVIDENLTARDVEKEVKKINSDEEKKDEKKEKESKIDEALKTILGEQQEKLRGILGTKVNIVARDNQKGKIEIEYYSSDDLNMMIERLESLA